MAAKKTGDQIAAYAAQRVKEKSAQGGIVYASGSPTWNRCDCHGFSRMVYRDCGYPEIYKNFNVYPGAHGSATAGSAKTSKKGIWKYLVAYREHSGLKPSDVKKGDIVLTWHSGAGRSGKWHNAIHHSAIYIGNGKVAEVTSKGDHIHIGKLRRGEHGFWYAFRPAAGGVDAIGTFLKCLKSHLGVPGHRWVCKMTGISWSTPWCAATLSAAAKETKYGGKIMPKQNLYAPNADGRIGFGGEVISKYGGKRISGSSRPQPGDIYVTSGHTGVVYKVVGKAVWTIEGNGDGMDDTKTTIKIFKPKFNVGDGTVVFYARPNWAKVGGSDYYSGDDGTGDGTGEGTGGGPLYTTRNTRADATIRKVCNMSKNGELTTGKSDLEASVVNYTDLMYLLNSIYGSKPESGEGESGDYEGGYGLDGIKNSVAKRVIKFLFDKKLNVAAVSGIAANIWWESGGWKLNARETTVEWSGGYGLCQWTGSRAHSMVKYVGSDWGTDIEGQLNYLWKELTSPDYKGCLNKIKKVKNTEAGAVNACKIFMDEFERPGIPHWDKRKNKAKELFKILNVEGGGSGNWKWPCSASYISSLYGHRNDASYNHYGLDIAHSSHIPITAVASGKVVMAKWYSGYGNTVRVQHSKNLVSHYAHMSSISVRVGQYVKQGDKVGTMGSTGGNYANHLHLGVYTSPSAGDSWSTTKDPYLFFPKGKRGSISSEARRGDEGLPNGKKRGY